MTARDLHLVETFEALDAISRRLIMSLQDDAGLFPATADALDPGHRDALKSYDAFLQRFNQLLDHTLRKLFPRLNVALTATDDLLPFRDVLDNLARAGIVGEVAIWFELIEVRNRLTHEYAMDPATRAVLLNDAWQRAPFLLQQLVAARDYARAHRLIGITP